MTLVLTLAALVVVTVRGGMLLEASTRPRLTEASTEVTPTLALTYDTLTLTLPAASDVEAPTLTLTSTTTTAVALAPGASTLPSGPRAGALSAPAPPAVITLAEAPALASSTEVVVWAEAPTAAAFTLLASTTATVASLLPAPAIGGSGGVVGRGRVLVGGRLAPAGLVLVVRSPRGAGGR